MKISDKEIFIAIILIILIVTISIIDSLNLKGVQKYDYGQNNRFTGKFNDPPIGYPPLCLPYLLDLPLFNSPASLEEDIFNYVAGDLNRINSRIDRYCRILFLGMVNHLPQFKHMACRMLFAEWSHLNSLAVYFYYEIQFNPVLRARYNQLQEKLFNLLKHCRSENRNLWDLPAFRDVPATRMPVPDPIDIYPTWPYVPNPVNTETTPTQSIDPNLPPGYYYIPEPQFPVTSTVWDIIRFVVLSIAISGTSYFLIISVPSICATASGTIGGGASIAIRGSITSGTILNSPEIEAAGVAFMNAIQASGSTARAAYGVIRAASTSAGSIIDASSAATVFNSVTPAAVAIALSQAGCDTSQSANPIPQPGTPGSWTPQPLPDTGPDVPPKTSPIVPTASQPTSGQICQGLLNSISIPFSDITDINNDGTPDIYYGFDYYDGIGDPGNTIGGTPTVLFGSFPPGINVVRNPLDRRDLFILLDNLQQICQNNPGTTQVTVVFGLGFHCGQKIYSINIQCGSLPNTPPAPQEYTGPLPHWTPIPFPTQLPGTGGPTACGSTFPACNGQCPTGQSCKSTGNSCECRSPIPCTGGQAPGAGQYCDNVCPSGQTCNSQCQCVGIPPPPPTRPGQGGQNIQYHGPATSRIRTFTGYGISDITGMAVADYIDEEIITSTQSTSKIRTIINKGASNEEESILVIKRIGSKPISYIKKVGGIIDRNIQFIYDGQDKLTEIRDQYGNKFQFYNYNGNRPGNAHHQIFTAFHGQTPFLQTYYQYEYEENYGQPGDTLIKLFSGNTLQELQQNIAKGKVHNYLIIKENIDNSDISLLSNMNLITRNYYESSIRGLQLKKTEDIKYIGNSEYKNEVIYSHGSCGILTAGHKKYDNGNLVLQRLITYTYHNDCRIATTSSSEGITYTYNWNQINNNPLYVLEGITYTYTPSPILVIDYLFRGYSRPLWYLL